MSASNNLKPASEPKPARKHQRQKLYLSESVDVEIICVRGAVRGRVIDVDPKGVGVLVPQEKDCLQDGEAVELAISTNSFQKSWSLHGVIRNKAALETAEGKFARLGIEILGDEKSELQKRKSQGFHFYASPEFFRPVAYFEHPITFGEVVHFQVHEVSPQGCTGRTSLRNKGLFPGLSIRLEFFVPTKGEFSTDAHILEVIPSGDGNFASVRFSFDDPPPELLAAIAEFILSFNPDVTVKSL
ncbi:hypothetical protein K2X33_02580, partial [bacterium]|nr:hypothetical protein [bacterium]